MPTTKENIQQLYEEDDQDSFWSNEEIEEALKTTYGRKINCRHPKGSIFKIGKTNIYASSVLDIEQRDWALIIDCSGFLKSASVPPLLHGPNTEGTQFNFKKFFYDILSLPWQDLSSPLIKVSFWKYLTKNLPKGDVAICCTGGHGRTGTALAAILMVARNKNADNAINWIRKQYCNNAVETESQINYLMKLEESLRRK